MVDSKDRVLDLVLKQKLDQKAKQKKLKAKRKRRKISIVILVLALGYLYWATDASKPKIISVSGNYVLSKDEVVLASDVDLSTMLIVANPLVIKSRLLKHPLIEDVKVNWSLVNRYVNIVIKEVAVFGYRQGDVSAKMLMLDGSHVELTADYYKFMPNLIFIEGFNEPSLEVRLIEAFKDLDRNVINQISEIHQKSVSFDDNYIELRMNDGNKVYTSFQTVTRLDYYFDIITNLKASNTCLIIDEMSGEVYSQPCIDVEISE